MFKLKSISKASIPDALEKAERYRLLNEPRLAQSICLDILEADPGNHEAVVIMLLSMTDQFGRNSPSPDVNEARDLLSQLANDYERFYYGGIICERKGKATLNQGTTGAHYKAYEWLREAMELYEKAEAIRSAGNDDSILRWNTCARLIIRNHLEPRREDFIEPPLE